MRGHQQTTTGCGSIVTAMNRAEGRPQVAYRMYSFFSPATHCRGKPYTLGGRPGGGYPRLARHAAAAGHYSRFRTSCSSDSRINPAQFSRPNASIDSERQSGKTCLVGGPGDVNFFRLPTREETRISSRSQPYVSICNTYVEPTNVSVR